MVITEVLLKEKKKEMTPSKRQSDIYQEWENTDNNLLIESVAGSGKTTVLLGLLERTPERSLFVAFNKSIQLEIEEKINQKRIDSAKAKTLHSLGLLSLRKHYKTVKINNNKKWDILNALQKQNVSTFSNLNYKVRTSLIFTLLDMLDVKRLYVSSTFENLVNDVISMGNPVIEFEGLKELWNEMWEIYKFYTPRGKNKSLEVDFIDMIFLPAIADEIKIQSYAYYLFIDECQDLNYSQHLFFQKLVKQGTIRKWVAVGDKHQSIYGFGGSYSQSFDLFEEFQKDKVKKMVLDICYRCPTKIIEEANEVYNVMEAHKDYEGKVGIIDNPHLIEKNSMVVCRNTAPLLNLYFYLIGNKIPVHIKGEDILGSVKKQLRKGRKSSINSLLNEYVKVMSKNTDKKNSKQRIAYYVAKNHHENISILSMNLSLRRGKCNELLEELESIEEKEKTEGSIELCTIHKSKGIEKDVVYILNENLIPSPFATTPEQLEQEKNLKYVARTRAKEKLFYLNLSKSKD